MKAADIAAFYIRKLSIENQKKEDNFLLPW